MARVALLSDAETLEAADGLTDLVVSPSESSPSAPSRDDDSHDKLKILDPKWELGKKKVIVELGESE